MTLDMKVEVGKYSKHAGNGYWMMLNCENGWMQIDITLEEYRRFGLLHDAQTEDEVDYSHQNADDPR